MTNTKPVYLGEFQAMAAGDVLDLYIEMSAALEEGTELTHADLSLADAAGTAQAGAVVSHSVDGGRVDFRLEAPAAAGRYVLSAVFTVDDGQVMHRVAGVPVVK